MGEALVTKELMAILTSSGAQRGDLVYVRSSRGVALPGARLTTAPDLLGLKLEALRADEPLVATGPPTDERFADIVIDGDSAQPRVVKARENGSPAVDAERAVTQQ